MIKISVILVILVGGLTLFGNAGLAGFYFPRITHTDLDYALMPFLGYLSICIISWIAALLFAAAGIREKKLNRQ